MSMDFLLCLVPLVSVLLITYQLLTAKKRKFEHKNQLPSPPGLPIIGHFHLLKRPLYQALNNLSTKYGPVFLLRLGSRPILVVSARSAIEECFTENDIIFANRPLLPSEKTSSYNFSTVGAPYGNHWRNIRRFLSVEMFSSKQLQMSSNIRTEEIRVMIKHLFRSSSSFKGAHQKVDIRPLFYMLQYNIIMTMVAGNRIFHFEEEGMDIEMEKAKLNELRQMFDPDRTMALGDYFPFLRWLAFFVEDKKRLKIHKKRDACLQAQLDAHQNNNKFPSVPGGPGGESSRCLIDVLLKLQESEPEFYTDNVIKGLIRTMLKSGTYSTVVLMESTISQLTSHPEILKKARAEIDNLVGQSRLLKDEDSPKLAYLHCIGNETLRLYTGVEILPPRESSEECTVAGYNIPPGTQLFVNLWAVHMDPELWTDPDRFKPERFQESEEEKRGFKFIAFGTGRRQCPGEGLAMRVMTLAVGTLIQCFEWEKAEDESHDAVKNRLNNPEDRSVKIIFRPREALTKVLDQL